MTVIAIMIVVDDGSVIVTVLDIVCIAMVTIATMAMAAGMVGSSGVGVMQQMVFRSRWSTRIQTHIYLIQTLTATTTTTTAIITIIGAIIAASKGGDSVRLLILGVAFKRRFWKHVFHFLEFF